MCMFVYLLVDYHHQGHFFSRERNDCQYQRVGTYGEGSDQGQGLTKIICEIVHLKTLIFERPEHLKISSKILAKPFSDSLAIIFVFLPASHEDS